VAGFQFASGLRVLIAWSHEGLVYLIIALQDRTRVARSDRSSGNERQDFRGIVSKKLNAPYKSGPSKAWLKIKNPKAPAATRVIDGAFWDQRDTACSYRHVKAVDNGH
jgi:hypothetical protein